MAYGGEFGRMPDIQARRCIDDTSSERGSKRDSERSAATCAPPTARLAAVPGEPRKDLAGNMRTHTAFGRWVRYFGATRGLYRADEIACACREVAGEGGFANNRARQMSDRMFVMYLQGRYNAPQKLVSSITEALSLDAPERRALAYAYAYGQTHDADIIAECGVDAPTYTGRMRVGHEGAAPESRLRSEAS